MTEEAFRHLAEKRYSNRFGALRQESDGTDAVSARLLLIIETKKTRDCFLSPKGLGKQSPEPNTRQKPSSNEVRKRAIRDEAEQGAYQ